MDTLSERIAYVISQYEGTQADLAVKINVTKSAVGQWKNGFIKNIRPENLFPLARETGFSAEWIGTGKGSMQLNTDMSDEETRLLKYYRSAPDHLKKAIMEVAEIVSDDDNSVAKQQQG